MKETLLCIAVYAMTTEVLGQIIGWST